MPLSNALAERFAIEHRRGLQRVRQALRFTLAGRDKALPALREIINLDYFAQGVRRPVRLYVPRDAIDPGPAILFFHGGGFVVSDIDTHDALCVRLAAASGVRVVSAAYGLAPEHRFPGQLRDAESAFAWLVSNAGKLGIDRTSIGVAGDSAGGYLAARVAAGAPDQIAAQGLIYPLVDLRDETWASSLFRDSRILGRMALGYIRAQLVDDAPTLLDTVSTRTPSTVMMVGGALDPVRPDALLYAEQLRGAGVAVLVRDYPGMIHGFANLTHISPVAVAAIDAFGAALGEVLQTSSTS